jgi:integrase
VGEQGRKAQEIIRETIMPIYKRGKKYWYHFWFNGEHIQESTKQGNPRVARQMEAAHKTSLAKGEVGIRERKPVPALSEFAQRFIDAIEVRSAGKPNTVQFYANKLARLLEFEPLAKARLSAIDESLIESYVQDRRKQVSPASVNRELATLRRLLRLAHEWREIDRVPRVRLLPGERERTFVLSHAKERDYLNSAPQPLHDAAMLMLDTGMRVGEILSLDWHDVHLQPVGEAKFGYIHVRSGKSKNAKRNLSLTARVSAMLTGRNDTAKSPAYVFTGEDGTGSLSVFTLEDQHSRVRKALKLSECVINSFRHTFGTRLGEAGADAFTIMRVMGHSSVTVSQKYVHPTPEAVERAFERLEALNQKAVASLPESEKPSLPATVSATLSEAAKADAA